MMTEDGSFGLLFVRVDSDLQYQEADAPIGAHLLVGFHILFLNCMWEWDRMNGECFTEKRQGVFMKDGAGWDCWIGSGLAGSLVHWG